MQQAVSCGDMALEIVWRNPNIIPRAGIDFDYEELYLGMGLCIVRTSDGEVIFQVDKGHAPKRIMEVSHAGGK